MHTILSSDVGHVCIMIDYKFFVGGERTMISMEADGGVGPIKLCYKLRLPLYIVSGLHAITCIVGAARNRVHEK